MPRILAAILNETIVAGMVVLLHAVVWRGSSLAAHLRISRAKDISWHRSMTGSEGFCDCGQADCASPLGSLLQCLPPRSFSGDGHAREVRLESGTSLTDRTGQQRSIHEIKRIYVQDRTIFLNTAGVYKLRLRSGAS